MIKKLLLVIYGFIFVLPHTSFATNYAYGGSHEFVISKAKNVKIHIIDYYNVLVILRIHDEPFGSKNVQCGVYPLDDKTRIGQFGENIVNFSHKEYGTLNGKSYYYSDTSTNLVFYRKICNNFVPKK